MAIVGRLPRRFRALCLAALVAVGCQATGRMVNVEQEGVMVDATRLGSEVEALLEECVNKLVAQQASVPHPQGKRLVAFLGVENASGENIGDELRESSFTTISTALVNANPPLYNIVSYRTIDEVVRTLGYSTPSKLLLPSVRDEFLELMSAKAQAPDYLLWAKFTSTTSDAGGVIRDSRQRKYMLTMELVDSRTGVVEAMQQASRVKYYEK